MVVKPDEVYLRDRKNPRVIWCCRFDDAGPVVELMSAGEGWTTLKKFVERDYRGGKWLVTAGHEKIPVDMIHDGNYEEVDPGIYQGVTYDTGLARELLGFKEWLGQSDG